MEVLVILGIVVLLVGGIYTALRWTRDRPNMKYVRPIGLVVLTIALILEGIPLGNTIITNLQSSSSQACGTISLTPPPSSTQANTPLARLLSDSQAQFDPVTQEWIGVSGGNYVFDTSSDNVGQELRNAAIQDKKDAAAALIADNVDAAVTDLTSATSNDPTDAEAQIYLANLIAIQSGRPFITLVAGNTFQFATIGGTRDVLQGVFIAQQEYNSQQSTQLVVLIANAECDAQATIVANQIQHDPSIVAVLGWTLSSLTISAHVVLGQAHILMVSPTASSINLSSLDGFLRVTPSDKAQAQVAITYLRQKRVALFYSSSENSSSSLGSSLFNQLHPVDTETYDVGNKANTTILPAELNKALQFNPDYIYFAGDVANMLILLKNLPPNGPTLIGPDDLSVLADYPNDFKLPKNVHLIFTAFASSHEWDKTTPKPLFFQEYSTNFDPGNDHPNQIGFSVPDSDAMLAYDAMTVLYHRSQDIRSQGKNITADTMWDLKTISPPIVEGVTGHIAYDITSNTKSDPVNKVVLLESMQQNGTITFIDHQGCLPLSC